MLGGARRTASDVGASDPGSFKSTIVEETSQEADLSGTSREANLEGASEEVNADASVEGSRTSHTLRCHVP